MTWSKSVWQKAQTVYEPITKMPFIQGLIDGTLDREKFYFYIAQDAQYLDYFGRTLSLIAARINTKEHALEFIRFAEGAIVVENALHSGYLSKINGSTKTNRSPACHHYTSFLLSTSAIAPIEVAVAAVLPCFRIYKEVGDYILANQHKIENPYQDWINTYSGEQFGEIVNRAIRIGDELAANSTDARQEEMTHVFLKSCQLEWMFWDSAWRLEEWPVAILE